MSCRTQLTFQTSQCRDFFNFDASNSPTDQKKIFSVSPISAQRPIFFQYSSNIPIFKDVCV